LLFWPSGLYSTYIGKYPHPLWRGGGYMKRVREKGADVSEKGREGKEKGRLLKKKEKMGSKCVK
jgi:hypothetical protein